MTVQIESGDWGAIPEADREKIKQIIEQNFEGQSVEAATGGIKVLDNPTCVTACNTAEAIAVDACSRLSFPANLVCVAAAHEAGKHCRSRC